MIGSSEKNWQDFIKKYNISSDDLIKSKITKEQANEIALEYEKNILQLESVAVLLTTKLQKNNDVHSVRFRIKNSEHLVEKIIRKNAENPDRNISINNYVDEITDLIGIRVLHIFKDEWDSIHNFILDEFDLKENEEPKVYYKNGDSNLYLEKYKIKELLTEEHKFGYRSIHYVIKSTPLKTPVYAEIQVRTIYEEAWSEIDHRVRYPYNKDHKLYAQILYILNNLSHSADEVGSFINNLKNIYDNLSTQLNSKNGQIQELYLELDNIQLPESIKNKFKEKFNSITKLNTDEKNKIGEAIDKLKNLEL